METIRSRAALLPHPADPFMFAYWLHFFNEVWQDEVDSLYVYINSPMEKPVIDSMIELGEENKKVKIQYTNTQVEHGFALNRILNVVKEDNVMLIEDDGFIFKKGIVDRYFRLIESGDYDVVGSPRGSCGTEIWNEAQKLWDLDYTHYGDNGPNFWPNFFFTKKDILMNTDRNFGARNWVRGEPIEALKGYIVKDENCPGDTFVNTSLQIRAAVPKNRIFEIPQYHCSTDDALDYERHVNMFDGKCPWIHVGSLSSGTHGALKDTSFRPLARRMIDPPNTEGYNNKPESEQEKLEWERRVTFWNMFWDYSMKRPVPMISEFSHEYRAAIDRIVTTFVLSPTRIAKRQSIYETLGL